MSVQLSDETASRTSDDSSTDEELPQWFIDSEPQRHDTLDSFERTMISLCERLDAVPHISGPPLVELSDGFEALAKKIRRYGFNVRDVGRDHWLFLFLESMWGLAVSIRVRLYGDAGIAESRPLYSYSVACIRGWVLNAHKFSPLPVIWSPRDPTPLPEIIIRFSSN